MYWAVVGKYTCVPINIIIKIHSYIGITFKYKTI